MTLLHLGPRMRNALSSGIVEAAATTMVLVLVTHHVYETVTEHYVRPVYRVITVHPLVVPFVNQKM